MFKKVLILGASQGLGRALARYIGILVPSAETLLLASRNEAKLQALLQDLKSAPPPWTEADYKRVQTSISRADLTKSEDVEKLNQEIASFDLVLYCAGGGPYGAFSQKHWKDHEWAIKLNFLTPARLIHTWLSQRSVDDIGRFVVVGSRIAESAPDSNASSYAAAKHALKGLISSLQDELKDNKNQAWLFSPGYMDTAMLPPGAHVRQDGTKLLSPDTAAQALLRWILKDGPWHRVI